MWKHLDPDAKEAFKWNRFSVTMYSSVALDQRNVTFSLPVPTCLLVGLSPLHPAARQLGVRYVAVWGGAGTMQEPPLKRLLGLSDPSVTLWQVPGARQ